MLLSAIILAHDEHPLCDSIAHIRKSLRGPDRMNHTEQASFLALRKQLGNLEEVIGDLNAITIRAPRDAQWDQVRDAVSSLDSIGDVMRQALDAIEVG